MHNMMQSDSIPQEQEGLHKYTGLLQTDVTQASAEWNTHTSTCASEKRKQLSPINNGKTLNLSVVTTCFATSLQQHLTICNANCIATWHPHSTMTDQTVQLWSKVDWNVPHLGTGIGLINLSSPLHRKAQPYALFLFISSTSHTNQTNPIWQQPMPTHGNGSKNLKNFFFFLQTYKLKEWKKGKIKPSPPRHLAKNCVPGGASFSTDARQLQPDPLIPRRHARRKGGVVGNIIKKNRIICTSGNLVGAWTWQWSLVTPPVHVSNHHTVASMYMLLIIETNTFFQNKRWWSEVHPKRTFIWSKCYMTVKRCKLVTNLLNKTRWRKIAHLGIQCLFG